MISYLNTLKSILKFFNKKETFIFLKKMNINIKY